MLRVALLFAMLAFSGLAAHAAEPARVITWDDLVPAAEPLKDPFQGLSENVLDDLSQIVRAKADLRLGFLTEDSPEYQRALETEGTLREEGIDAEALIQAAKDIDAEIERRGYDVVGDLDGALVRMPGYALPLEATDKGVKEFLLVPYVGACIHTPPPPPNQTVYVELGEAYAVKSLYEPVWITGQIKVQASSRALSFVDGQADIPTGYTLKGLAIEPYE